MNRYAAAGVLADVRAGKRVLVVAGSNTLARVALWDVTGQGLSSDEKVHRSNGREKIESPSGGWARFRSVHGSVRGLTADVVLLDTVASDEELAELKLCIASAPGGEVIRA